MKNTKAIATLALLALLASMAAAAAIGYPPERIPAGEVKGGKQSTRHTYVTPTGTVYTVWEAPPEPPPAPPARFPLDAIIAYHSYSDPTLLGAIPLHGTAGTITSPMGVAHSDSGSGFTLPTPDDLADAIADWENVPAYELGSLWNAILDGYVRFPASYVVAFVSKVAATAKNGPLAVAPDTSWAANPLSKQMANSILLSILTLGRQSSGLDSHQTAVLDFFSGGTRYLPTGGTIPPLVNNGVVLYPIGNNLPTETIAAIRSQVDFSGISLSAAALPPQWNLGASWGATTASQSRNFAGAFTGINLTGVTTVQPLQIKQLPTGALKGAVLTGSGITRSMLSSPPFTRPSAELDTITF